MENKYDIIRRLFLLLVSIYILGATAVAQDVIVLKYGDLMQAKVLEIGENDVRYKKWENIDGPTYTISIAKILAINYQNGTKDSFANYEERKVVVADSINVSNSINYPVNGMSEAVENSFVLPNKREDSPGRGYSITGRCIAICGLLVGAVAAVFEDWVGVGVNAGLGMAIGFPLAHKGDKMQRAAAAENLVTSIKLLQYNVNDDFAINACAMEYKPTRQKSVGAGMSFYF